MQELGRDAHTLNAQVSVIAASLQVAKLLNISKGEPVINLKLIFGIDNKTFAFFNICIKYEKYYSLDSADYYGSFYQYL